MYQPEFQNRSEEGLELSTNGFGDIDYQQLGETYPEPIHYTESATYNTSEALETEVIIDDQI